MDKDVGMSKYEFQRFMDRLPAHCIKRFEELGMTFESVAGCPSPPLIFLYFALGLTTSSISVKWRRCWTIWWERIKQKQQLLC